MSILLAFKVTASAILQIFVLGFLGYALTKKKVITVDNLGFLTSLVINLFFPLFAFANLISHFNFRSYPNWWLFPLISLLVTAVGFCTAKIFVKIDKDLEKFKREFISLVTFQNGGYLPLILVALLLPPGRREQMYIYIFLFLLGFNALMWSAGVIYLTKNEDSKFEWRYLFSPPVIAIISALFLIAVGLNRFIPVFLMGPVKMMGDCALPLAIMVVGANLSQVDISSGINFRYISQIVTAKLIFLPLFFLGVILLLKPSYEIALLLLLQAAMPSATTSSIIMRHYEKKDNIISLGIFWTHVVGLLTISIFLILFSALKDFIFK
jgi:predicted permease